LAAFSLFFSLFTRFCSFLARSFAHFTCWSDTFLALILALSFLSFSFAFVLCSAARRALFLACFIFFSFTPFANASFFFFASSDFAASASFCMSFPFFSFALLAFDLRSLIFFASSAAFTLAACLPAFSTSALCFLSRGDPITNPGLIEQRWQLSEHAFAYALMPQWP